jgi:hypothetical protein
MRPSSSRDEIATARTSRSVQSKFFIRIHSINLIVVRRLSREKSGQHQHKRHSTIVQHIGEVTCTTFRSSRMAPSAATDRASSLTLARSVRRADTFSKLTTPPESYSDARQRGYHPSSVESQLALRTDGMQTRRNGYRTNPREMRCSSTRGGSNPRSRHEKAADDAG